MFGMETLTAYLAGGGLLLAVIALALWLYQTWLVEITVVPLATRLTKELRVVQLSDLHGRTRFLNGSLSRLVNRLQPDLVLITGDLTNRLTQRSRVIAELGRIRCAHRMFIPGNHEWYEYRGFRKLTYRREQYEETLRMLRETGIQVLENAYTIVETRGGRVAVSGFDNAFYGNEQPVRVPEGEAVDLRIAMGHAPGIVRYMRRHAIDYDLLLAGHTHGGQIRLGSWSYGIAKKYHTGLRTEEHRSFYINRGLGNVHLPLRWGSRPELTVFHLLASQERNA